MVVVVRIAGRVVWVGWGRQVELVQGVQGERPAYVCRTGRGTLHYASARDHTPRPPPTHPRTSTIWP